ncbi:MAG: nif-specific transcriptional activator NifA [Proteobacteria bacterium]|nr:nif-specific transcriptional activator NifA [Pseudomonadota bacterium]MBU1714220.1 nif-specific transcriptional activator NifA [Pseudomonadota bacterium]
MTTNNLVTTERLEVRALYQIAQLIESALDLDKALSETLRILHETLRMERATLVLPDESGASLSIRASYGLTHEEAQKGVYRLDEGIIGKIFSSSQPFVVPDILKEPMFLNRTGARNHLKKKEISFIGVPVILMEKPVGVLSVDRLFGAEVSFEEDIRFLTVVATLIAQFLNLHRAIVNKEKHLIEENISLKEEMKNRYSHHNIIGQCKAMQEVFRYIEKVAPSRATTLLLGESGTGKELVAKAIHFASPRQEKPFIKVNCAALPETLLESELFGHEKGAFTGAHVQKKGRFELANGGTLFLDELGELPLHLQAKLLRVLQEQNFERLGGTVTISVDVRIIAATNRSLEQAVEEKSFREDLFYRLNVVPINLPPLRNRIEDIPILLDHFLRESNRIHQKKTSLSREVINFLINYQWPGNVRELQNLIERLVIMADDHTIEFKEIPSYLTLSQEKEGPPPMVEKLNASTPAPAPAVRSAKPLEEIERREVEAALIRHGWVQARAARELGLTQRQIGYKIKKFAIDPPDYLR